MYVVSLISFLPGIAAHMLKEIDRGERFWVPAPTARTTSIPRDAPSRRRHRPNRAEVAVRTARPSGP